MACERMGRPRGARGRLVCPAHPSPWSWGHDSPGALILLGEVGGSWRGGGEQAVRPLGGVRCGEKRGDQGPTLGHLGWSITRLHDDASWGLNRSIWAARHRRRGLPAPPRSWPQPPSSASGCYLRWRGAERTDGARSARKPRPGAQPGWTLGPRSSPERAGGGMGRRGQGGGGRLGAGQAGSGRAGQHGLAGRGHVTGPL